MCTKAIPLILISLCLHSLFRNLQEHIEGSVQSSFRGPCRYCGTTLYDLYENAQHEVIENHCTAFTSSTANS